MRLSIWQQFSSNHSSSYTVVGEFQSSEAAQEAGDTILRILRESGKWCFDNREECYQLNAPTPIEKQYGLQYGFDWKERIDWLTYGSYEQAVSRFDRLVVVEPTHVDTWQTGHQFVSLLNAMGAKVAQEVMGGIDPDKRVENVDLHSQSDVWMRMGIEIRCEAATAERAAALVSTLTPVFQSKSSGLHETYPIPWLIFHPQLTDLSREKITEL
jgi:hypothetical protein